MDPIALIVGYLGPQLAEMFGKSLLEKGLIEPALKPWIEPLQEWWNRGHNRAKKDKALAAAIRLGIQQAGVDVQNEEQVNAYLEKSGLARLQANNPGLHRIVARSIVGYVDEQAEPPEELRLALAWPHSRSGELGRLLQCVRQELATVDEWKDLLAAANAAQVSGGLNQVLDALRAWDDAMVRSEAGAALRVVLVDQNLSQAQAQHIERDYRQKLVKAYQWHDITRLKQLTKVVRLPLQDIYTDLGLIPLVSGRERQEELERQLEAGEAERLELDQRRLERRSFEALKTAQRLVVVGQPGSGKTVLLKYMALLLGHGAAGAARLGLAAPYLPVYVRLADYALKLKDNNTLSLETFLQDYLHTHYSAAPRLAEYLFLALEKGACLVLLDGLDEVADLGQTYEEGRNLQTWVRGQIQTFADIRCDGQGCNRLVVTSRLEGYELGDLPGFMEMELSSLRLPDETEALLLRWFSAYLQQNEAQLSTIEAEERARREYVTDLMPEILRWKSLGRLAVNPLMLTFLAVFKVADIPMPHRRAELYKTITYTIIESWRQTSPQHTPYHKRAGQQQPPLQTNDIVYLLAGLAGWLHSHKPGGAMPNAEWEAEMARLLQEKYYRQDPQLIHELLAYAQHEAGLLAQRSPGQIGFFHLTIEEYLAGLDVARSEMETQLKILDQRWQNPYWHETLLLAADILLEFGELKFQTFIRQLLSYASVAEGEQAGRPAVLAGRSLLDVRQGANPNNPFDREILQALKEAMQDLDHDTRQPQRPGRVAPRRRAEAADLLDELGWLPEGLFEFIAIDPARLPQAAQRLGLAGAAPFWIGRYPVTNLQYERFLQPENFADHSLWVDFPLYDENSRLIPKQTTGPAGWDWLQEKLKDENPENTPDGRLLYPRYWNDPRFGIARRAVPVVGVSWWEANAYARWLGREPALQPKAADSPGPRLPTEAEWLLAAGGDQLAERYPWDDPHTGATTTDKAEIVRCANIYESGIGRTTPVGMYPQGSSRPFGLWDLAGNVWEWQANYLDKQDSLGLRGGSWLDGGRYARPALRFGSVPWYWDYYLGFRLWFPALKALVF